MERLIHEETFSHFFLKSMKIFDRFGIYNLVFACECARSFFFKRKNALFGIYNLCLRASVPAGAYFCEKMCFLFSVCN